MGGSIGRGVSGFGFLKEIRQNLAYRSASVPVLSARDPSEAERTDLRGNVQGTMQKGSCSVDRIQTAMCTRVRKPTVT